MHLVNEEDHISVTFRLLKKTRDDFHIQPQRIHELSRIKGLDPYVIQAAHLLFRNLHGQALDDCGLADAGLTEQHGIVLVVSDHDGCQPVDFGVPSDCRRQFAPPCHVRQVNCDGVSQRSIRIVQNAAGPCYLLCLCHFFGLFSSFISVTVLVHVRPEHDKSVEYRIAFGIADLVVSGHQLVDNPVCIRRAFPGNSQHDMNCLNTLSSRILHCIVSSIINCLLQLL